MKGNGPSSSDNKTSDVSEFLCMDSDHEQVFAVVPLLECPHIVSSVLPFPAGATIDVKDPCGVCGNVGENWICLSCYKVNCSRFVQSHGSQHFGETKHALALGFADLSVWCYECSAYVHNSAFANVKNAAHRSKFGVDAPS